MYACEFGNIYYKLNLLTGIGGINEAACAGIVSTIPAGRPPPPPPEPPPPPRGLLSSPRSINVSTSGIESS